MTAQRHTIDLPAPEFESKICAPTEAPARIRRLERPLVFTNGCFDILHRGHVTYLAQAQTLGASLIVALNTDQSVRRLSKGAERPINALASRAAVVAALASVDLVTWFDADTPLELIVALRPDILVKGGDWPEHAIVGAQEVRGFGGQVVSIAFRHACSTTDIVRRIRADS